MGQLWGTSHRIPQNSRAGRDPNCPQDNLPVQEPASFLSGSHFPTSSWCLPNLSQEFSRLTQAVLSMSRLLTAFVPYQSIDPPCIPLLHEGVYSFLWLCNKLSQTQQLEAVHIYHLPVSMVRQSITANLSFLQCLSRLQ